MRHYYTGIFNTQLSTTDKMNIYQKKYSSNLSELMIIGACEDEGD
jgi:hypothetical protein